MKAKTFILFFLNFLYLLSQNQEIPSVYINDHNRTQDTVFIDCNYNFKPNKGVELTAHYPDLRQTNTYNVNSINYAPVGNFSEGSIVNIQGYDLNGVLKKDDTFSAAIPIGFQFCFYGNSYNQLVISDNGIVSFNMNYAEKEAPFSPILPLPSGAPVNSIFGVFHDMQNIDKVRYYVTGTAPYRKFIINYDAIPQYAFNVPGKTSSSQIVLYETTNVIEVYVKDRYENTSTSPVFQGSQAFRKNAAIGISNIDSSLGMAAPGRDTGNWDAHNEAWRFVPAGASNISLKWKNQNGNQIGSSNPITVYPTDNTFYTAEVTYNLCNPITVSDTIHIQFSQDFPTAQDITTEAFCVNQGDSKNIDLTQYQSSINSDPGLTFSYFEDINLTIPISNPADYSYSNNKTIYVKVLRSGICYIVSKINLRINKKPVVTLNNLPIEICDTNNDKKEYINFYTLINYPYFNGLNGNNYKVFESLSDAENGTSEITTLYNYLLDVSAISSLTKTFYIRFWNSSINDPNCYSIVPFDIKLKPYVELKPHDAFICYTNIGDTVITNLTQYNSTFLVNPTSGTTVTYYRNSNFTNQINNPATASVTLNTILYVKVSASGYCDAYTTLKLTADPNCDESGEGGEPGGNPGSGEPGGAICDAPDSITKNLDTDYLQYFLPGSLTLSDITILGFYSDATYTTLVSDIAPYTHTFYPPYNQDIWVKYYINSLGNENIRTLKFTIKASQKAELNPHEFNVCDTYNDGIENNVIVQSNNNSTKPEWQKLLESLYPGATIYFFASNAALQAYIAQPSNPTNIANIIYTTNLSQPSTPVYVYVGYLDCIYTHEITLNLSPIDVIDLPPYTVCDFEADNKENINLTQEKYTDAYKNYITNTLSLPLTSIKGTKYYTTLDAAYAGGNGLSNTQLTNYLLQFPSNMEIYIRIDFKDEEKRCYTIFKLSFEFTTAVSLPVFKTLYVCDTNNNNQEMGVDLSPIITSSDPNSTISFYTSEIGANSENPSFLIGTYASGTPLLYDITAPSGTLNLYIRTVDNTSGCWKVSTATITLIKIPELTNKNIKICDSGNDSSEEISTSEIKNQLLSNNSGITTAMQYAFFASQSEAEDVSNTNSLSSFTATTTNSIWVRISQTLGNCYAVYELKFNLIPPPELQIPEIIYICNNNTKNDNNTISETVNLNNYKNNILGFPSTPDYVFTYYNTETNALTGTSVGQISNPNAFILTAFPTSVYVRVIYNPTGCFSVSHLTFNQYESLDSKVLDSQIIFCATGELNGEIDLTEYPPQMIVSPASINDFNISYHSSKANAINNIAITSDITEYYVTPSSEIWIKFVDKITGCFILKKLSVTIYGSPKAQDLFPEICDASDGSLDGQYKISNLNNFKNQIITGEPNINDLYIFSYYKDLEEAQNNSTATSLNPLNFSFNQSDIILGTSPDQDYYRIWVRIDKTDGTGCYSIVAITFLTNPKVPVNPQIPLITECDSSDNDGFAEFDLTSVSSQISTTTGVTFTYYPTELDAQNNTNIISTPTQWTNATAYNHTVFVRVSAADYCDNIAQINLKVYPYIQAEDYSMEICEFTLDGHAQTVDLSSVVGNMTSLINSNPNYPNLLNDIQITYYNSLTDAQNQSNNLSGTQITNYLPAVGSNEIWVRFQSATTNCYEIKKLTITKLPAPPINDISHLICDDDLNDEYFIVLNTLNSSVPTTAGNYTITYHDTLADAWSNTQQIDQNTNFVIPVTDFPKTIAVRVVDNDNNCVNSKEIILTTNPKVPVNPQIPLITECDSSDNDGFAEFDLTSVENQISTTTGVTFTYYPTELDAQNNTNIISNPTQWTNATAYNHTVFVRVSAADYCDNIAQINLKVYPYIQAEDYSMEICEFTLDGQPQTVDLSSVVGNMTSLINSNPNYPNLLDDIQISYYNSLTDAQNQSNNLSGTQIISYLPTVGSNEIWVRFQSSTTDCYEIKKLTITKIAAPELTEVNYYICDDNLDGFYYIVPQELNNSGFIPDISGYNISYYTSSAQAWSEQNPLSMTSNHNIPSFPYSIFVRVTDSATGCTNVGKIIIQTYPKVEVASLVELYACDDDDDGFASFDLSLVNSEITSESPVTFSYYPTLQDAQNNENEITNFNSYQNINATTDYVYVRVEQDSAVQTKCPALSKIRLNTYYPENPLPEKIFICPRTETVLDAGNFDEYLWSTGETTQQITVTEPGTYSVTVTKNLGHGLSCPVTFSVEVEFLQEPVIHDLIEGESSVTVIASGPAPLEYSLDQIHWQYSNVFNNLEAGIYEIFVRSKANGCEAISSQTILFKIPNVITPNGDGKNDTWNVYGLSFFGENPSYLKIFDRYGKLIFEQSSNDKFMWDGLYLGRPLPSTSYWYLIKIPDGREFKGWILLRNYNKNQMD